MLEVVDNDVYLGRTLQLGRYNTLKNKSIVESDSAGQRSESYAMSSRSEYRSVSRRKLLTSVCCQ